MVETSLTSLSIRIRACGFFELVSQQVRTVTAKIAGKIIFDILMLYFVVCGVAWITFFLSNFSSFGASSKLRSRIISTISNFLPKGSAASCRRVAPFVARICSIKSLIR